MSPYIMSHMHLGSFSRTRLEQHCARRTDTHELDVLCARNRLTCRVMGHLLHKEQYLLDQHVNTCVWDLSNPSIPERNIGFMDLGDLKPSLQTIRNRGLPKRINRGAHSLAVFKR